MSTDPQGQRSWNTLQSQSVAGRPCPCEDTLQVPCSVKPSASKRNSIMWLMRTPSEYNSDSYASSLADSLASKSSYPKDADSCGSFPFIADVDLDIEETALSSTRDAVDYLIHFSSSPSAVSEADHDDFPDFDDTDSETDVDSDSDAEAQYITIPPGNHWWKAPPATRSVSFDTIVDEDNYDEDSSSSSHSLSEVLQQQQILVGVFHDELRRMIPKDHLYDDDWLREVDAKLLLAPVESFEEACRSSMMPVSKHLAAECSSKPLPDVPLDFVDAEDEEEESMDGWEWEYPLYAHRANFVEAHTVPADRGFIGHMVH